MDSIYGQLEIHATPQIHRCEPEWHWHVDSMPDHDIWCVLNGHGEIHVDGDSRDIGPGSCWLLEPGMLCHAVHDPANRLRVFSVHFDPVNEERYPRRLHGVERPALGVRVRDLAMLEALCRGCVESFRRGGALGGIQGGLYLRQLLFLLLQESQHDWVEVADTRVAGVHQAILEDPGQAWTVAGMAHLANLSRSQFSRLFRSATGRSPLQCLLDARISRACYLLGETQLRVGEIAELLGYNDIFYFSRQFKDMVGKPPSEFRAEARFSVLATSVYTAL